MLVKFNPGLTVGYKYYIPTENKMSYYERRRLERYICPYCYRKITDSFPIIYWKSKIGKVMVYMPFHKCKCEKGADVNEKENIAI